MVSGYSRTFSPASTWSRAITALKALREETIRVVMLTGVAA
jgi:hypothetical protein